MKAYSYMGILRVTGEVNMQYLNYAVFEAVELFKLCLVMYVFTDINFRSNKKIYAAIPVVFVVFNLIFANGGYNLVTYTLFSITGLLIIYQGRLYRLILMSIWAEFVVAFLDVFTEIIVSFLFHSVINFSNNVIDIVSSVITLLIIFIFGVMIKKVFKRRIHISFLYYICFLVIVIVDGILLETYIDATFKDTTIVISLNNYVLLFLCSVGFLIEMMAVMVLAAISEAYKEKDMLNKRYLKMQEEHFLYLEEREQDTRKLRHDIKNHTIAINHLIEDAQYDELKRYMMRMQNYMDTQKLISVNNGVADAIINQYIIIAGKENIDIEPVGKFPSVLKIDSFDLCTILSNILQNAIENINAQDDSTIRIEINSDDEKVYICESNSYNGKICYKNGSIITGKEDKANHGFGLINIRAAVRNNGGSLSISTDNNKFTITIMLDNTGDKDDSNC